MLSKAEMEEMWRTGSVGCLKKHRERYRGKKRFKIRITPIKIETIRLEEHAMTVDVWARNYNEATYSASSSFYSKIRNAEGDVTLQYTKLEMRQET